MMRRVQLAVRYLMAVEPARLVAVYRALAGVVVLLGVTIPANVDGRVVAVLGALGVVLTLLQGEWTRAKVVPVPSVAAQLEQARAAGPPM